MMHNDIILNFHYTQYKILENLIYSPETTKEEREEYLLKIMEIERKMGDALREKYEWED